MKILVIVGVVCIIFGIIDFAGMFLGYDITGVFWSPYVAGLIGGALIKYGSSKKSENSS